MEKEEEERENRWDNIEGKSNNWIKKNYYYRKQGRFNCKNKFLSHKIRYKWDGVMFINFFFHNWGQFWAIFDIKRSSNSAVLKKILIVWTVLLSKYNKLYYYFSFLWDFMRLKICASILSTASIKQCLYIFFNYFIVIHLLSISIYIMTIL